MYITIKSIKDDERFEYKGNVRITGSIGKNATVIIKDGSLIVDGDVGTGSNVTLKAESNSTVISTGTSVSFAVGGAAESSVHVKGNIGSGVRIITSSADIIIDGFIDSSAKFDTQSGDIRGAGARRGGGAAGFGGEPVASAGDISFFDGKNLIISRNSAIATGPGGAALLISGGGHEMGDMDSLTKMLASMATMVRSAAPTASSAAPSAAPDADRASSKAAAGAGSGDYRADQTSVAAPVIGFFGDRKIEVTGGSATATNGSMAGAVISADAVAAFFAQQRR